MKQEQIKFAFLLSFVVVAFFIIPYFIRKIKNKDIKENSKYAICEIFKKTSSLKSGEQWHYRFKYKNSIYESYRSTHIDYDVSSGDFF